MPEQISSLFIDFRLNSWPSDEDVDTKVGIGKINCCVNLSYDFNLRALLVIVLICSRVHL